LADAWAGNEDKVIVSFPLRVTPVFKTVREIVESGRLGTVNQVQAVNNVPYGGCYFGNWYRNYEDAGGLWLQKATHDVDYINVLLRGMAPTAVAATMTRRIYGGDKPHDLRCSQCDEAGVCPEGPEQLQLRGNAGGMNWSNMDREDWDHPCPFSREIKNQDAGSALILYADNSHASYSQNFVNRLSAGRRGARITGYDATLDFDFDGSVHVVSHRQSRVDELEVKATGGHGGGDGELLREFRQMLRDGAPSTTSLGAGLLSAAICLAARESCHTNTFQPVPERYAPKR
jgi:predicted dehydrogenase